MRTSTIGAVAVAIGLSFAGQAGAAIVTVNTDIDGVVENWTNANEYILARPIFVKNGGTLNIEEGTIVRGQPRTAAVLAGSTVGTPGAVIVTQTGTINALGSPTSPIIMTTAAVDNDGNDVADDLDANGFLDAYPGFDPASCTPGPCTASLAPVFHDDLPKTAPLAPLNAAGGPNVTLWGGVVVLGNATTNVGTVAGLGQGRNSVEGLSVPGFPPADAIYGGNVDPLGANPGNDLDSSGELRYLSIRHAGDEIGNSNELNGLTLAGVGSGTIVHHIEIYCNFDDGIEWFGGTVNGDHLQVAFAGDDTFDIDQGYRGTNQFLVGIMTFFNTELAAPANVYGSAGGDKGCECDGDDSDVLPAGNVNLEPTSAPANQPTPFQNMNFYNFTIAGSRPSVTFNGHTNDNDGWEVRHGFAGSINNGLIFNTGGDGLGGAVGTQGLDVAANTVFPAAGSTDWDILDNVIAGRVIANAISCNNTRVLPALSATAVERTVFTNGTLNNASCTTGVNDAGFRLADGDTSFQPKGVSGKLDASLGSFDLRPQLRNAVTAEGVTPAAPLDTTATYRGAFDAVPAMWTDGWTVFSQAGMQPVPEPGMASMIVTGALGLLAASRRRR